MSFPKVIGRYEIIDELGRGAMGSVFKAKDPAVGRTVALKTILSAALAGGQSEEYRARFYREARASGVLAHPGIVPVFDVGEHDGVPFLVMEFVDGRTLADAVKKGERFTLDRVCEIGQQIADALGYAHRQGVIHRDIKPANILLTSREVYGSERPRITDFGIAKLAASEITTTGQLLGTPSFMPPEQFTGMPIDGRADLFSLGVILYSLATGEQPFAGETMTAVSYKVVYTEPIPPSKLNPAIPPRLESAILKALAKNPADRYQTGEELAQDLAAIRAHAGTATLAPAAPVATGGSDVTLGPGPATQTGTQPVAATVPSAQAPAAKKLKKPARVETIFAVALLGVAALGVGGWFVFRLFQGHPAPPPTPPQLQQAAATTPAPLPAQAPATSGSSTPPQAAQTPAPPPAKASAPAAKPATASKPAVTKPQPAPAAPPPAATQQAATRPAPAPVTPVVPPAPAAKPAAQFDPRKADPNANAKVRIDVSKFPNGVPFDVEMNKQPYIHFITGDGASLDNLYVPPGVQQFRVTFKTNGQEWDSNIVSENFKAKKKKTLKLQLLVKGQAMQKIALPISKDAQLFLSFSTSLTDSLPF